MTEVVAALLWDGDKFMICQRPAHKARGLLWEFVGGKVEPGETKEAALIRECQEELGIIIAVKGVFMDVIHTYPDLTVHLTLFHGKITEGEPQLLEHHDLNGLPRQKSPVMNFARQIGKFYNGLQQAISWFLKNLFSISRYTPGQIFFRPFDTRQVLRDIISITAIKHIARKYFELALYIVEC